MNNATRASVPLIMLRPARTTQRTMTSTLSLMATSRAMRRLMTPSLSVVQGSELDIMGGIFLAVRSTDPSEHRRTVCMFYVVSNISQNHLSRSSLQALDVIDHDIPRIGSASSRALRPFINSTNTPRATIMVPVSPQPDHRAPQVMPFHSDSPCECPANILGP